MATFAEIKAAFPDISDERAQAMSARGEQLKDPEYHQHIASIAQARKRPAWKPSGQLNIGTVGSRTVKPSRCCKSGPGGELKALLQELDIPRGWCESCSGKAAEMDEWGVGGCRERIDLIRGWMIEAEQRNAEQLARDEKKLAADETPSPSLVERCKNRQRWAVAWAAMRSLTWIDPTDPHRSIVMTAIRRAEEKLATECPCEPATAGK